MNNMLNHDHTRKSNYGIGEVIKNEAAIFLNKLQFPTARLIRYPVVTIHSQFLGMSKKAGGQ